MRGERVGTLLNGLFGVGFDVMNEADRKQTTKGPSRPLHSHPQMLTEERGCRHLDGERREDGRVDHGRRRDRRSRTGRRPSEEAPPSQLRSSLLIRCSQDFERKAALFSMAAAEVIIVNMWEHQVGLYQGANMGLLKTVFEVNLALFQAGKGKKKAGCVPLCPSVQPSKGCD